MDNKQGRLDRAHHGLPGRKPGEPAPHARKVLVTLAGIGLGFIAAFIILLIILAPKALQVIDWRDAKKHVGKEKTVEGEVYNVFYTSSNNIFMHFNKSLDDDFAIIIYKEQFPRFNCTEDVRGFFTARYGGRHVRVTGRIRTKEIVGCHVPAIFVADPGQIQIIDGPLTK
jgi:hypothetical protein